MNMEWMNLPQAAQAADAQTSRAGRAPDAGRSPPKDSFRTQLERRQAAPDGRPAPERPGEEPGTQAVEVPDQRRVLAAALAVQAAIVPVETPDGLSQTAQAPAAQAAAEAAVRPETGRETGWTAESLTQGQPQPEAAAEGQPRPTGLPEEVVKAAPEPRQSGAGQERSDFQAPDTERTEAGAKPAGRTEDETAQVLNHRAEFTHLFRDDGRYIVKVGEPEVIDTGRGDLEGQLARQVTQAREKGWQHVEILLEPESLGRLVLTLDKSADGALHVTLHASSEKTAGLLGEHADGLSALLQSGQSQQVTVEVQRRQEDQQAQYQQQSQDQGGQQGRQSQQERRQQQTQDFIQQLRLGLVDLDGEAS